MAEAKFNLPGMGGLMKYDSEYTSRFMLSPMQVLGFVVIVILTVIGLNLFW